MHGLGHVLKLFYYNLGPLGDAGLLLLALGLIWLGYKYSARTNDYQSIRRPPKEP